MWGFFKEQLGAQRSRIAVKHIPMKEVSQAVAFIPQIVYDKHMTKKQQFLEEHNRLSSLSLQATTGMLSRFRAEKPGLFRDSDWSVEKLRRPFILWLTSFSLEERDG